LGSETICPYREASPSGRCGPVRVEIGEGYAKIDALERQVTLGDRARALGAIPDSTLADCQQLVADLQRQLTECRAERDGALAREAPLAEVLQATNSSPGDRTPVFDAILEKAHALCGVEHGALVTYDGEYFRLAAGHGMPQFWTKQHRRPYRGGSNHERLLCGERCAQVADARAAAENPQRSRQLGFECLQRRRGQSCPTLAGGVYRGDIRE
jgi:hypothetical protein